MEECVFYGIRGRERASLDGYQNGGGYDALREIMAPGKGSEALVKLVTDSGLVGRGRGGSPTGAKWRAAANAPGDPKTIVCNAAEGEPGCFKDRCILDFDPHAVIEGMTLAAFSVRRFLARNSLSISSYGVGPVDTYVERRPLSSTVSKANTRSRGTVPPTP